VSSQENVMGERVYVVEGMTCDHCVHAVRTEVGAIDGVDRVDVDLATKVVRVHGDHVEDAAVQAAVDEAGYEAVPVEGRA
jgi:copper chaperone CopZ